MPPPLRGAWGRDSDLPRRPKNKWWGQARAYHHPNPLRTSIILFRCQRHARLRYVPMNPKEGLGGGIYR
jgi:hypothetical protein